MQGARAPCDTLGAVFPSSSDSATMPAAAPRLLTRLRTAIRVRHYSPRTGEAYVAWVRRFVHFSGDRHPAALDVAAVEAFLSDLATRHRVSASTENQARAALVFLYRVVLEAPLPGLDGVTRAKRPPRLPTVLTRAEVNAVLGALGAAPAPHQLVGQLLYGAGLRLMEGLRLRVKDVDLPRGEVLVRAGKGGKDRVTVLPTVVAAVLTPHLARVRALHARDLADGGGRVAMPGALARKLPGADASWPWQWVFPATSRYRDPATGAPRRHHLHETAVQRAVRDGRCARGSPSGSPATRCGTRSRHTCWRTATTSGRCRSCSGIATCGRR